MAVTALRSFAAAGTVAVYPVIGGNALRAVEDLSLHPRLAFVRSPRHADLLLVAGDVRDDDHAAVRRLHDQMPHPRATLWWRAEPDRAFIRPEVIAADEDPAAPLVAKHRELVANMRSSEADILPNEPPAPWRGEGDHGQGGEGMMGGTPYGRPMPMTDDDLRDGLALDPYRAAFGPFLPMFPPGLLLQLTLQGDVIQTAKVDRPPLPQQDRCEPTDLLRRIARLLRVLGLEGQARRLIGLAHGRPNADAADVRAACRRLRWFGAFQAIPKGLARIPPASQDVRGRLRQWCEGEPSLDERDGVGECRLGGLLTGLEWSEAILVINSFAPQTLRDLSADRAAAAEAEDDKC